MEVRTQQASTHLTRIFTVDFHGVLAGYFETLRTPVLAGRTFAEDDIARRRNVAVIDQLLANEAFPNESAGGKRIFLPFGEPPSVDVIGVVGNQRMDSPAEPGRREQIYFSDSFVPVLSALTLEPLYRKQQCDLVAAHLASAALRPL